MKKKAILIFTALFIVFNLSAQLWDNNCLPDGKLIKNKPSKTNLQKTKAYTSNKSYVLDDYIENSVYVYDVETDYVGYMDVETGDFTPLSNPGVPYWLRTGLYMNGIVYMMEQGSNTIYIVNADGTIVSDGITSGYNTGLTGLAYDEANDVIYATDWNGWEARLYTVDPSTWDCTLVGLIGGNSFAGIACDGLGNLYAIETTTDHFWSIEKTTAVATVIGPIGFDIKWANNDICGDRIANIIYGTIYDDVADINRFGTFNVSTGAFTELYLPNASVTACAIVPESPSLSPPTDLIATVSGYDVSLTWNAPLEGTPDSYNIYRDDAIIANITETDYDDLGLAPGIYEYCVTAVYDIDESICSTASATIVDVSPPENFDAVIQGSDVACTWDPIESKDFLGYRVYDNEIDISGLITATQYNDENVSSGTHLYFVKAEYDEGISEPSNFITIVITGIDEFSDRGILIYPNPAKDFIIVVSEVEIQGVTLMDCNSEVLINDIVSGKSCLINAKGYSPGLYLLKLRTKDGIRMEKLIIH